MRAAELISHTVPILKKNDTGTFALHTMYDHHLSQLPLVQEKKLMGLVLEEDILNHHNNNELFNGFPDLKKSSFT